MAPAAIPAAGIEHLSTAKPFRGAPGESANHRNALGAELGVAQEIQSLGKRPPLVIEAALRLRAVSLEGFGFSKEKPYELP